MSAHEAAAVGRSLPRIRRVGESALLIELELVIDPAVNARVVAIADALRQARPPGVHDVVPTYRTVAVYFDPRAVASQVLDAAVERASRAPAVMVAGRHTEVPVAYGGTDGPDLADVASFAHLPPEQVIARHAATEYRVFMLGFVPGFAYMGLVPREIAAPRRARPRMRVPAGSVAIAGEQTAVYPRDSPGGWQIIGRTAVRLFDPLLAPAALLAPGDSVRFVPAAGDCAADTLPTASRRREMHMPAASQRSVTVLRPGLFTTVQDCGRRGHLASAVSVSGALDPVSHRVVNVLVGNDHCAAALEITITGPELRLEGETVVAVAGADLEATLDGRVLPLNTPARGGRGSVLRFGQRRSGARAYVGFDGGIAVPEVLGSRSTHTLTAIGGVDGRALAAGDRLALGVPRTTPRRRNHVPPIQVPGGVRVRILPGPQEEFFPAAAFEALEHTRFTVAPQSNRMGYRLSGACLPRVPGREMISDATFTGAIQVPASGEPILLMADRQTTGGYPQIATVIAADLPLAAQLAPGDWIEFQICSRAEALRALIDQEGMLLALE